MEAIAQKEISVDSVDWSCRNQTERLYPDAEWVDGFFPHVKTIGVPFFQKLVDMKGLLTLTMGEWTLYASNSVVMFHLYDGFVNLECISTGVEDRGQGSATLVMNAIVAAAKETNTEIRLRACNVTGHGYNGMPNHVAVAMGMSKKGKIPTAKLQNWYEKFGFVKVGDAIRKGKKSGVNMIYNQKQ